MSRQGISLECGKGYSIITGQGANSVDNAKALTRGWERTGGVLGGGGKLTYGMKLYQST